MRTNRHLFFYTLALCGLLAHAASGNGGGYQFGIKFTGGIAPFEPEGVGQVQIVDEKLDIEIGDKSADVEVRYVMKNISDNLAKVTFGFPIESGSSTLWDLSRLKRNRDPDKERVRSKKELAAFNRAAEQYTYGYQVSVDGVAVKHDTVIEEFAKGNIDKFPGSEALEGLIGWRVSSLEFAKGQERRITIRYNAAHELKGTTMSNRSDDEAPVFRYRLSTGGVWAGPIAKGRVRVKFVGTDAKWCEVRKPAQRFTRPVSTDSDTMVWEFENLEPTLADDIEVVAGPKSFVQTIDAISPGRDSYYNVADRWWYRHQDYEAVASSTKAPVESAKPVARFRDRFLRFGTENLVGAESLDWGRNDWEYKAWAEGVEGDGASETITLTVNKPMRLDAISVHPGYGRSEEFFKNFGRPSKMEITLNGEHSFTAEFNDRNETHKFLVEGYTKPVETILMVIKEVYAGGKFDDTCISDVELYSHLDGKPKLGGAR